MIFLAENHNYIVYIHDDLDTHKHDHQPQYKEIFVNLNISYSIDQELMGRLLNHQDDIHLFDTYLLIFPSPLLILVLPRLPKNQILFVPHLLFLDLRLQVYIDNMFNRNQQMF